MRKYRSLFILIIVVGWVLSCQQPVKERLCQSWQLNGFDIKPEYEKKLTEEGNKSKQALFRAFMQSFMKEMTIKLYSNGDFSQISQERYSVGRYTYDENSSLLTLQHPEGNRVVFRVTSASDGNLHLVVSNSKDVGNDEVSMSWKPQAEYEYEGVDLLTKPRNQWRVKPAHPESGNELKKRLVDQLGYMVDYFEMTDKKKQGYFKTGHLASPFRFYQNGVGLYEPNELPTSWKDIFYDEVDAQKAYLMLVGAFRGGLVYPNGTSTYTEGYSKFLKQLKVYIATANEPS